MSIKSYPLKRGQWFEEATEKKYVVWHGARPHAAHTVVRPPRPDAPDRRWSSQRRTDVDRRLKSLRSSRRRAVPACVV